MRLKRSVIGLSLAASVLVTLPVQVRSATFTRGSIAGLVIDKQTGMPIANVRVRVDAISTEERFEGVTDAKGGYHFEGIGASVYSVRLSEGDANYPVVDTLDARVHMPFLLESCFELDRESGRASVSRKACPSGLVEPTRVATIGPHRYLKLDDAQSDNDLLQPLEGNDDEGDGEERGARRLTKEELEALQNPTEIGHEGLECIPIIYFPQVNAEINPGPKVQTSRVYFRSDKYPDFYYVEMEGAIKSIDDFRAILPKPSAETEAIIYYVEAIDSDFNSLLTEEYTPVVVYDESCKERDPPAWFEGNEPGIVVGATRTGLAAVPAGFESLGITGFINSAGVLTGVGAAAGGSSVLQGLVLIIPGGAVIGGTVIPEGEKQEASPP